MNEDRYDDALTDSARHNAIADAKRAGYTVIRSSADRIQLDLDGEEAWSLFLHRARRVMKVVDAEDISWWQSKSGKNRHVLIDLKADLGEEARIALQFALGSDPKRETLGILRVLNGVVEPSLLFRPKDAIVHRLALDTLEELK